jgi:hypothetical protein
MKNKIFLLSLFFLAAFSMSGQTIKNSSIAVQPTLDNTVPFEFNPIFRYDTTNLVLYVWDNGAWTVLANGAGGGTDDQTASEVPIVDAGGYYVATEVEAALQEGAVERLVLDGLIGNLVTLSGVPVTSTNLGTFTGTTRYLVVRYQT